MYPLSAACTIHRVRREQLIGAERMCFTGKLSSWCKFKYMDFEAQFVAGMCML